MIFEQKLAWSDEERSNLIERARLQFKEMVLSGELFMLVTPDKNYFCIKCPFLDTPLDSHTPEYYTHTD